MSNFHHRVHLSFISLLRCSNVLLNSHSHLIDIYPSAHTFFLFVSKIMRTLNLVLCGFPNVIRSTLAEQMCLGQLLDWKTFSAVLQHYCRYPSICSKILHYFFKVWSKCTAEIGQSPLVSIAKDQMQNSALTHIPCNSIEDSEFPGLHVKAECFLVLSFAFLKSNYSFLITKLCE